MTPFDQHLKKDNRWVMLAHLIPWDEICNYLKHVGISNTGRPPLSPRLVIGSLIIKHICNLDDRETVDQISENMYFHKGEQGGLKETWNQAARQATWKAFGNAGSRKTGRA